MGGRVGGRVGGIVGGGLMGFQNLGTVGWTLSGGCNLGSNPGLDSSPYRLLARLVLAPLSSLTPGKGYRSLSVIELIS